MKLRFFKSLFLGLALALGAASTAAADDCQHCEQYQHLVPFSLLGVQAGDISLLSLHPEQDPLAWTMERREAMRTSILSNALIPADCKQFLISKNLLRFTVVASGSAGSPPPGYNGSNGVPVMLLSVYQQLVDAQVKGACGANPGGSGADAQAYNSCVTTKGRAAYDQFRKQFEGQTPQQLIDAAKATPGTMLAGLNTSQVSVMQAYNHILGLQTNGDLETYLGGIKGKLNTDEKLLIGQMIGYIADHPGYDNSRNKIGSQAASGVVTTGQILGTANDNTLAGGFGGNQNSALIMKFGVCRDIHSVIGIVERDLGIPHSVVVSFAQTGGYHVTWAGQDPNNPMLNHQINYGTRNDTVGGSSRSLFQGSSDASLNYRLSLPGGRSIADIQSQQGIWLAGAAGFRPTDPFARNDGYFLGGAGALGANGHTNIRVGVGQDGNGAQYGVAGVGQSWGQDGHMPGQAGLLFGTQVRSPAAFGNADNKTYSLDFVYAQLEQKFRTGELKITPALRARFETTITAMGMASRVRSDGSPQSWALKNGAINGQGDGNVRAEVIVNQGNPGDKTQVTYKAGVQVSPGISDIRNNEVAQVPIPVLDGVFLSADVRHKLGQTSQGNIYLVAAAKLALDELGERGRAEIGIASDHLAFTTGAEGRLTNATATFQPGTGRQVFGMFSWMPNKHVNVGVTAYVPMEDSGSGMKPTVMGTGILSF